MALFGRKKQQSSVLPDEVNQYYQSQRREKTGVVFMLGVLALIATLLVGLAVFFGGRYIYNKVRGNDTQPSTATVQTDNGNAAGQDLQISEAEKSTNNSGDQEVAPTEDVNTDNSSNTESNSNTVPDQTPNLGDDEPATLPRTGDEGH